MITLEQILREHQTSLRHRYGERMRPEHHAAIRSILACHTPDCGEVRYRCAPCQQTQQACPSCGHRSCPACQHGTNRQWLERQRRTLLPVDYFLVTFTLPAQLRGFAWHHLRWTCHALFQIARETLNQFARNDQRLGNQLGLVGVLHTHSRRLAFHPPCPYRGPWRWADRISLPRPNRKVPVQRPGPGPGVPRQVPGADAWAGLCCIFRPIMNTHSD